MPRAIGAGRQGVAPAAGEPSSDLTITSLRPRLTGGPRPPGRGSGPQPTGAAVHMNNTLFATTVAATGLFAAAGLAQAQTSLSVDLNDFTVTSMGSDGVVESLVFGTDDDTAVTEIRIDSDPVSEFNNGVEFSGRLDLSGGPSMGTVDGGFFNLTGEGGTNFRVEFVGGPLPGHGQRHRGRPVPHRQRQPGRRQLRGRRRHPLQLLRQPADEHHRLQLRPPALQPGRLHRRGRQLRLRRRRPQPHGRHGGLGPDGRARPRQASQGVSPT